MSVALHGAALAARLVGGWRLLDWEIDYPDQARITLPFGVAPQGLLLYTADGWMSAAIQRAARSPFVGVRLDRVPDVDKARAFGECLHYAGRWHVDHSTIVHEVAVAQNPTLVGTRQERAARLVGDRLELSASEPLDTPGARRVHRIRWHRASA